MGRVQWQAAVLLAAWSGCAAEPSVGGSGGFGGSGGSGSGDGGESGTAAGSAGTSGVGGFGGTFGGNGGASGVGVVGTEAECNGIDDDNDGVIDNVDVDMDGVCDCLTAVAIEADLGKVFVWGDEWITFDSDWSGRPEFQVELFWVNTLKWLTPITECQVPPPVPPE